MRGGYKTGILLKQHGTCISKTKLHDFFLLTKTSCNHIKEVIINIPLKCGLVSLKGALTRIKGAAVQLKHEPGSDKRRAGAPKRQAGVDKRCGSSVKT